MKRFIYKKGVILKKPLFFNVSTKSFIRNLFKNVKKDTTYSPYKQGYPHHFSKKPLFFNKLKTKRQHTLILNVLYKGQNK